MFKGLTCLSHLGLGGTKIGDTTGEHIQGLTTLEVLHLGAYFVTDAA